MGGRGLQRFGYDPQELIDRRFEDVDHQSVDELRFYLINLLVVTHSAEKTYLIQFYRPASPWRVDLGVVLRNRRVGAIGHP